MARKIDKFPVQPLDQLLLQLKTLERRLEDGDRRIVAAQLEGKDASAWETHWIELLHQYEAVCDGLNDAKAA